MNTQIYEEASDWLVKNREDDLDAQEKSRFDAWLRESPQHIRAYLEISTVWEHVAALDPNSHAGADELIARARAEENIFPLEVAKKVPVTWAPATEEPSPWPSPGGRGKVRFYALAASVLLTLAGTWLYSQRNSYSTDVGEQRSIVLSDGSTIEMNSRSRVRVRFSDAERDVDLIEGQALFRVAKNPLRPFIVSADGTLVRAVGTQFDVYRKNNGTVVTVVEGTVAVSSSSALPPGEGQGEGASGEGFPIRLAAGEQLTVSAREPTKAGAQPSPKRANLAAVTAWTRRSLVFDSSPLTEVAEEFNRYNTRQLVIEDSEVGSLHISGVFSSVDPVLLLKFLRTQPELAVEQTDTEIRISKK